MSQKGLQMADRIGFNGCILWVDLIQKTSRLERRGDDFWRLYAGGGLLATRLLIEKTRPGVDPLGPENLLIFTSSVIAGHPAPGLARFTVAAKSALTGGIGEARCEGPFAKALKGSGADVIVFVGKAQEPTTVIVEDGRVVFQDAKQIWGRSVGAATDALEQALGSDIHVAAIGSAGERCVRYASIVTDRTYQAMRMGMGAVMGSKNLKAVVLRGGSLPEVADSAGLHSISGLFAERMRNNELSRWQLEPPGFSCWLYLHGLDAALCVNNYSRPIIEGTENFRTEEFLRRTSADGNCPGCPNNCIKYIQPADRQTPDPRATGIHQEVTGTLGPNIGITDLDWVLAANAFCNEHGLDPVSLGFSLSFAMELFEKGILTDADAPPVRFGDSAAVWDLMNDIVAGRGLGKLLGQGVKRAAQKLGRRAERYAMHVKGLEMVCFEPRSQTNLALGYAVAPIGPRYDICEHDWDFDTTVGWEHTLDLSRTIGILERISMNYIGPDKVRNFKALHVLWSAADALDFCIFAVAPTRILSLPEMGAVFAAVTGWKTSDYEIMRIGERRLHLMRWYNLREGLSAADDALPERFHEEQIASGPRQGDCLDRAAFREAIDMFYAMMGWDSQGRPLPATLFDHGLEWVL